MIAVSVEVGRVPQQLRNCQRAIRDQWWPEYASQAMSILEREQSRHFADQAGPDGKAWPALSALTLALSAGQASRAVGGATRFTQTKTGGWKAKGKGAYIFGSLNKSGTGARKQMTAVVRRTLGSSILNDTGILRASITAGKGKGAVRRVGKNYLDFGTKLPQAKRLQFGGTWPVTAKQRAFLSAMLGEWFLGKEITTPARPFLGVSKRCQGELSRGAVTVANRLLKAAVQ